MAEEYDGYSDDFEEEVASVSDRVEVSEGEVQAPTVAKPLESHASDVTPPQSKVNTKRNTSYTRWKRKGKSPCMAIPAMAWGEAPLPAESRDSGHSHSPIF